MRALLNTADPLVIIGTLWPELYDAYATLPTGGADPRAREREVLGLADLVRIAPEFSSGEQDRARAAAARDRRLAAALDADGYGLTQTLAAAPQLVAHWEDARTASPYAWAVLTSALDVARLGARAPLSAALLRAAAVDYCTSQQQAEAPQNWFEQALAYATKKLHGAAAALNPAGRGMGQLAGYTVADYLLQHVGRERRTVGVPASTWDAIPRYVHDPADAARLAYSARSRLLYRYALPLYRRAADAGDKHAAEELADLLARRWDLDELRGRAEAGDKHAAEELARRLARRGDLDELRGRAKAGDKHAAGELARCGDLDGAEQILRTLADVGNEDAALQLATLLARRGNLDGAEQILHTLADAGHGYVAGELIDLPGERGRVIRAGQILYVRTAASDWDVGADLICIPAGLEDVELDELHARADAGDQRAAGELARRLAERGDLDELRGRADAGDWDAAMQLANLLAEFGDLDEAAQILRTLDGAEQILRTRADAGDEDAAWQLDALLAERWDLDGLRARADAGDEYAAGRLANLLGEFGDLDEAARILRALDGANDEYVARELDALLARRGDLDELRARAHGEDLHAAQQLARILAMRGDLEEAEQILRASAIAGHGDTEQLAQLLTRQGRGEEAERLRRIGLNPNGSTACA
jgi:hypothetical protein